MNQVPISPTGEGDHQNHIQTSPPTTPPPTPSPMLQASHTPPILPPKQKKKKRYSTTRLIFTSCSLIGWIISIAAMYSMVDNTELSYSIEFALLPLFTFLLFGFLSFAGLFSLAKQIKREKEPRVGRLEKLYVEIHALILLAGTLLLFVIAINTWLAVYYSISGTLMWPIYFLFGMPVMLPMLLCFLSVIRQFCMKNPKLLLEEFYQTFWRSIKRSWMRTTKGILRMLHPKGSQGEHPLLTALYREQALLGLLLILLFISVVGCFLLFLLFGLVALLLLFAILIPAAVIIPLIVIQRQNKQYEELSKLLDQIEAASKGDFQYDPQIDKKSVCYEISKQMSGLTDSFQHTVEEQVKSERTKIALVTNVSHDLKTPLTSIISYVDLLGQEDLPDEAKDYVKILQQKSERLKNIVADLFDLAKVTSGETEMQVEALDMSTLVIQTIGDMEDTITQSGLQLRQAVTTPPVPILADGGKLYRVLQNVIDNALKYSMEGTRVYLDLQVVDEKAVFSVKNTAQYEMTFTADEIMERFVRGDESRSTEGNGLGLSIAKSFTEANDGTFEVFVDGDQFKVIIAFPITTQSVPTEEE